jgi:hypothetical protein
LPGTGFFLNCVNCTLNHAYGVLRDQPRDSLPEIGKVWRINRPFCSHRPEKAKSAPRGALSSSGYFLIVFRISDCKG